MVPARALRGALKKACAARWPASFGRPLTPPGRKAPAVTSLATPLALPPGRARARAARRGCTPSRASTSRCCRRPPPTRARRCGAPSTSSTTRTRRPTARIPLAGRSEPILRRARRRARARRRRAAARPSRTRRSPSSAASATCATSRSRISGSRRTTPRGCAGDVGGEVPALGSAVPSTRSSLWPPTRSRRCWGRAGPSARATVAAARPPPPPRAARRSPAPPAPPVRRRLLPARRVPPPTRPPARGSYLREPAAPRGRDGSPARWSTARCRSSAAAPRVGGGGSDGTKGDWAPRCATTRR